jgi:hypothetical protein
MAEFLFGRCLNSFCQIAPACAKCLKPLDFQTIASVHVSGLEGVRTSRRHHRLLGLLETLGSDARPCINGQSSFRS